MIARLIALLRFISTDSIGNIVSNTIAVQCLKLRFGGIALIAAQAPAGLQQILIFRASIDVFDCPNFSMYRAYSQEENDKVNKMNHKRTYYA